MLGKATLVVLIAAALHCAAGAARADDVAFAHARPVNASQIFDRALGFVRSQHYPPYVTFVVTVHTATKRRWLVEQFQSMCRSSDDRVITYGRPLSTNNPGLNPYGFNVKVRGLQLHDTVNIDEPFGLPEMSPLFDFGLARLHPASSALREYDVVVSGADSLNDRRVYHLALTPRDKPKLNRLRDLWIDAKTFAIWRLRSAGAFRSGPATTVPWEVDYAIEKGHWLIASESTPASMLLGGYAPALDGYIALPGVTRYDGVSYSFSSFDFPTTVRDFVFFESKPSQAVQM